MKAKVKTLLQGDPYSPLACILLLLAAGIFVKLAATRLV